MPEPLTKLERRILDYLIDYLRRNTYQPSIREIGRRFNIKSTKTVSEHLQSLADKGWIERDPSRSRGVRLLGLDLSPETLSVPCYRTLAGVGGAGGADDAYEIDRRLASGTGTYFVAMAGDSMVEAGIRDGDLLLVEPVTEEDLEDGDIVVARLDGEARVKRYFLRAGELVLEPANRDYPPILVREREDCVVAGRVTAVFRRLRTPQVAAVSAAGDAEGSGAIT